MPNRILKESICYSEDINQLTPEEEVFFYRLMVSCDDFGRIDARLKILKSKLYPLKDIDLQIIENYLIKLNELGLVSLYKFENVRYLQLTKWDKHQRVRAKWSKCPSPQDEGANLLIYDSNLLSIDSELLTHDSRLQQNAAENPNPNPNPNPLLSSEIFSDDAPQVLLSKKLFELIKQKHSKAKEPNIQSWAKDIDKMMRLDNRTPDEIEKIINWCQKDAFWHKNILSTKKLREKYDQLYLQMMNPSNKKEEWKDFPQRKYDKDFFESLYKI